MKYLYIISGTLCVALGLLGVLTPGLPTTPFILLAGFLYAKSSPYLYKKLENNRITGRYLKGTREGWSVKTILVSVAFMWIMVCFTAFVVFEAGKMRYIMIVLGIIGTISQFVFLRKKKLSTKNAVNIEENKT